MQRLPKLSRPLIVAALLMLPVLASAQVYKWTDAGGTVHFSQAPPPQGVKFDKIKTNVNAASLNNAATNTPPAASTEPASQPSESQPKTVPDTADNRKTLCASLKANLATLQASAPVVVQQDGNQAVLDAAQRKQQAATAQSRYDEYCQGN